MEMRVEEDWDSRLGAESCQNCLGRLHDRPRIKENFGKRWWRGREGTPKENLKDQIVLILCKLFQGIQKEEPCLNSQV